MNSRPSLTSVTWRKASGSGDGNCVEVAAVTEGVAVRDSKDPSGPVLFFSSSSWAIFLGSIRSGDFGNDA